MPAASEVLLGLVGASLLLSPPIRSQETQAPPGPLETFQTAYPDSVDGLRRLLQSMLTAAKSGDQHALWALIKDTEIPNYQTWFTTTFGQEKGESWADPYGDRLAVNEAEFQGTIQRLAPLKGDISTRKVNGAPKGGNGMEKGLLDSLKQTVDIFYAEWNGSEGDADSRNNPIGYFMFIDGRFRWDSTISAFKMRLVREGAPPPSDPPGQFLGQPVPLSDSEAEQLPYHAGKDGVGNPICVYCPLPQFTKAATKAKFQGTILLRVVVQPNGRATNIKVVRSVGLGLDETAVEAVRNWHFQPAADRTGKIVPVIALVECTFRFM
jgi:TonB family protein